MALCNKNSEGHIATLESNHDPEFCYAKPNLVNNIPERQIRFPKNTSKVSKRASKGQIQHSKDFDINIDFSQDASQILIEGKNSKSQLDFHRQNSKLEDYRR